MKFDGSVTLNVSQSKAWEFLTDADSVAQCAPGVETMQVIEPNKKFKAVAAVGFGNIKAKFSTEVEFVELVEPDMAKIKAHGVAPGSAVDVLATMNLSSKSDNETELQWEAEINVLGTIAALANRMMGSVTQKLTAQFFECVKQKIEM